MSFSLLQTSSSSSSVALHHNIIVWCLFIPLYSLVLPYLIYNVYILSKLRHLILIHFRRFRLSFLLIVSVLVDLCVIQPLLLLCVLFPFAAPAQRAWLSYLSVILFVANSNFIACLYLLRIWLYFFDCKWIQSSTVRLTFDWFTNSKQLSSWLYVMRYIFPYVLCSASLFTIVVWFLMGVNNATGILLHALLQCLLFMAGAVLCVWTPRFHDTVHVQSEMRATNIICAAFFLCHIAFMVCILLFANNSNIELRFYWHCAAMLFLCALALVLLLYPIQTLLRFYQQFKHINNHHHNHNSNSETDNKPNNDNHNHNHNHLNASTTRRSLHVLAKIFVPMRIIHELQTNPAMLWTTTTTTSNHPRAVDVRQKEMSIPMHILYSHSINSVEIRTSTEDALVVDKDSNKHAATTSLSIGMSATPNSKSKSNSSPPPTAPPVIGGGPGPGTTAIAGKQRRFQALFDLMTSATTTDTAGGARFQSFLSHLCAEFCVDYLLAFVEVAKFQLFCIEEEHEIKKRSVLRKRHSKERTAKKRHIILKKKKHDLKEKQTRRERRQRFKEHAKRLQMKQRVQRKTYAGRTKKKKKKKKKQQRRRQQSQYDSSSSSSAYYHNKFADDDEHEHEHDAHDANEPTNKSEIEAEAEAAADDGGSAPDSTRLRSMDDHDEEGDYAGDDDNESSDDGTLSLMHDYEFVLDLNLLQHLSSVQELLLINPCIADKYEFIVNNKKKRKLQLRDMVVALSERYFLKRDTGYHLTAVTKHMQQSMLERIAHLHESDSTVHEISVFDEMLEFIIEQLFASFFRLSVSE